MQESFWIDCTQLTTWPVKGSKGRLSEQNEITIQEYVLNSKQFQSRDRVCILNPRNFKGRSPKWDKKYGGPFEVVKRLNDVNYVVRKTSGLGSLLLILINLKSLSILEFVL